MARFFIRGANVSPYFVGYPLPVKHHKKFCLFKYFLSVNISTLFSNFFDVGKFNGQIICFIHCHVYSEQAH